MLGEDQSKPGEKFNPELLYYFAGNQTELGRNLTTPVSRDAGAYLEWGVARNRL